MRCRRSLSALLAAAPAHGQRAPEEPGPLRVQELRGAEARARPDRETISATYLQATRGFIAGGRRYDNATFEDQNGVAPALSEPFLRAPYDGVTAFGLGYDLRATVS